MNKQDSIIMFLHERENGATKAEIVEYFGHTWYFNGYGANRYIGEILARMVRNCIIQRVSRGHYKIMRPGVSSPQLDLFTQ